MVNVFCAAQVISTVIVHGPAPVVIPPGLCKTAAAQSTFATVMLPVVGCVQPVGTTSVSCEPALKSLPFSAANVNVSVLAVELANTDVGFTPIAPPPSTALPSVNVCCAVSPDGEPTAVAVIVTR